MYSGFRLTNRPENRPIPVRQTGQHCLNTVPEASPEKPEIAHKPHSLEKAKSIISGLGVITRHQELGSRRDIADFVSTNKPPAASYTAQGPQKQV